MPEDTGQGYNVGSAWLAIVPSFRGVQQAIDAQARRWGATSGKEYAKTFNEQVRRDTGRTPIGPSDSETTRRGAASGGKFADGFKRRVEAALRALPDITIDANSNEAQRKIAALRAELESLSDAQVGVDISDADALARLATVKAALDDIAASAPTAQVRADTAAAAAKLAEVQAEVTHLDGETANVRVDADTTGAVAGIEQVGSLLLGLSPALIPLAAGGAIAFGGLSTGLLAAAGGAGSLILGLSGVASAVKAVDAARKTSAVTASHSATAEVNAAAQVKSAEQGLAESRRVAAEQAISAAERVRAAKAGEVQAAQAVRVALDGENAAREQAVRDLQDYADAVHDATLNAQQSQLDLASAQQNLATVQANPTATPLQLRQAQLDVARAQQQVAEANQAASRATQDNTKAQAAGVAGDKNVVAAAKQVADARRQQAHATQQLKDAQRAQADQRRQSAYTIQQAENAVASAERAQAQASQTVTTASAKQAAAMNALSPAGRHFASFVLDVLQPALHNLRGVAERNLLPGLQSGIEAAMPLMGPFTQFVGTLSRTVGGLADEAGRALNAPFWRQFFVYVDHTAGPSLRVFAHTIGNLATGFAGLLEAAQPAINMVGRGILSLTGRFADFGRTAGNRNSPFQGFLRYAEQSLPLVGRTLEDVARAVGHIVTSLAPFGVHVLAGIDGLARIIDHLPPAVIEAIAAGILGMAASTFLLNKATGLLGGIMEAAANPFGLIAIGAAVGGVALIGLYDHSKKFHDFVDQHILPVVHRLIDYFHGTVEPILNHVANDVLDGLRSALHSVEQGISNNSGALGGMWNALKNVVDFMVKHVLPVVGKKWKLELEVFGKAIEGAIYALSLLWKAWVGGINFGISAINLLIRALDKVLGPFGIHIHTISHIPATLGSSPSGTTPAGPTTKGIGVPSGVKRVPGLAAGGTIGPGFVTNGPRAIVGEGSIFHPEYVIPTDPTHRDRAVSLYQSLGAHLFAGGGVLGGIGGAISGALHGVTSVVADIAGFARTLAAKGAGAALRTVEAPAIALLHHMPDTFIRTLLEGAIERLNAAITSRISGHGSAQVAGAPTGTQVANARIIAQVGRQLGASHRDLLVGIMTALQESHLINLTGGDRDSAGLFQQRPSQGWGSYGQVTTPSYAAAKFFESLMRYPQRNTWPLTKEAQEVQRSAYPDAYAKWQTEGEKILELIGYDQGGALRPGLTLAYNGTGRPEQILTGEQLDRMAVTAADGRRSEQLLKQIAANVREVAPGVTRGVVGGFTAAADSHARRTLTAARKSV